MGKITVLISVTPDGFAESQNVIIDNDFFEFTHSLLTESEVALFGKTTFELFEQRWQERLADASSPAWVRRMAVALNEIQKIVFSTTLKNTSWNNSQIVGSLETDKIRSLKNNTQGALITFGSLSIVEALVKMDVIDDYYFNFQPLIAGAGNARFFNTRSLPMPRKLEYIDHHHLRSGAHIIHYRRANDHDV